MEKLPHNSGPQADHTGARTFFGQMPLDTQGMAMLDSWFRETFDVDVTPATTVVQLKGIDLCVKLRNRRGARQVGVDLKADNNVSGNISLELISQDRPNSKHSEPVVGWTGKGMPLVAQLFMKTGEMVVINMTIFYPWLFAQLKDIVEGRATQFKLTKAWLSATPNPTYQSFNIIVSIETLLNEAPGCLYIRAQDVLTSAKYAELVPAEGFQDMLLPRRAYDPVAARAVLEGWLAELRGYDVKPQLTAMEKERLLRFMEPRVRYSRKSEEIGKKGRALQASRPRLKLPEDATAAAM
jgi:hypothetical protein